MKPNYKNYSGYNLSCKMKRYLFLIFFFISTFLNAQQVPDSLLIKVNAKYTNQLFLTSQEISDIKNKIQTQTWAKQAWVNLLQASDGYIKEPFYFPEGEGGWTHQFVSPVSGAILVFDKNSPHKHYDATAKLYYEGKQYDNAWNSFAMEEVARRMEVLAIVALVSGDKKYANALKILYLDAAEKYEKYRIHDRSFNVFGDKADDIAGRAMSQSIDECNLLSKLALSYSGLLATNILLPSEQEIIEKKLWGNANKLLHRILDKHPSGGNWWVWHSMGGFVVGLLTNDEPLINQAINDPKIGVLKMLRSNYINQDGIVNENSPGYQLYAMMAISRMALISKHIGFGFEKISAVEKGFYAFADFQYPDFTIPNLNDTRKQDLKSLGNINKSMTFLDFLELGWGIYGTDVLKQNLSKIYTYNDQNDIRSKGIIPLLFGPAKINTISKELNRQSSVSKASGIAMLRSSEKDWTVLLKNTNPGGGHAHPNTLHVAMFANGEEFIPSFGTPEYGHSSYNKWFTQSLAHNTVVLNMINQNSKKVDFRLDWVSKSGAVAGARASVKNIQNPDKDFGKALELSRTLIISPFAIYDFFNVNEDNSSKKSFTKTINSIDWVMHFNGKIVWNKKSNSSNDLKVVDATSETINDFPAYRLLSDVNLLDTNKTGLLQGTLSQPKGGNVSVNILPVNNDFKNYTAMGLGYENSLNDKLPLMIRRGNSNNIVFGGVYVPYNKENPIKKIKVLKQNTHQIILSTETNEGSELVFQNTKSEILNLTTQVNFEGYVATITTQKSKDKRYFLVGKSLTDADGTLLADKEVPVSIVIKNSNVTAQNHSDKEVILTWKPNIGNPKKFILKPL
jgi:hypothetical protein